MAMINSSATCRPIRRAMSATSRPSTSRSRTIKAATLDQVKSFYKEFYGASNGEVVIIGDFDPESTQKQLATLFNDWKSPKPFTRVQAALPEDPAEPKAFEAPDKANAIWIAGVPSR